MGGRQSEGLVKFIDGSNLVWLEKNDKTDNDGSVSRLLTDDE